MNQVLAAALLGPSKYIFPRFGLNLTIAWEQIFGLGRPAGQRAAAAGAFKKADPLGPKRLGSRESIHAGQRVPAPHLVPSRSLDQRLVCPGPRSGCPRCVRVRPGLINRAFGRCIGQRPDPLDEGQVFSYEMSIRWVSSKLFSTTLLFSFFVMMHSARLRILR